MALHWTWSDLMGKAYYTNGAVTNIYQGNAFMIALNEWEKDGTAYHNLAWFAADEQHFKNILGLSKDYDECWSQMNIIKLRLNTKYKSTQKIVSYLAKANVPIEIELYHEYHT